MKTTVGQPADAGRVVNFPTPQDRDTLTVRQLADAYCVSYKGRDHSKLNRVESWATKFGGTRVVDLDADRIADLLDAYAAEPVSRYLGRDRDGEPIVDSVNSKGKSFGPRRPATVNRMESTLGSMILLAKDRRLLLRGWSNPLRDVRGRREDNIKTRFVTLDEQQRLLKVARLSSWRKMHLFILMALHTGARKSELLNLRGDDLNLETRTALLKRTKNGKQRILTLTPQVVEEIKRVGVPKDDALLFASKRKPEQPFELQKIFAKVVLDAQLVTKDKPDPVGIHTPATQSRKLPSRARCELAGHRRQPRASEHQRDDEVLAPLHERSCQDDRRSFRQGAGMSKGNRSEASGERRQVMPRTGDFVEMHWDDVLDRFEAGDFAPLVDALRRPNMVKVPQPVRAALADLVEGRCPRKAKARRIGDPTLVEFHYLACRASGMSAGKAIEDVMARYNVEHSAAYEAVTRVLLGGDKLEAIFHNRGP